MSRHIYGSDSQQQAENNNNMACPERSYPDEPLDELDQYALAILGEEEFWRQMHDLRLIEGDAASHDQHYHDIPSPRLARGGQSQRTLGNVVSRPPHYTQPQRQASQRDPPLTQYQPLRPQYEPPRQQYQPPQQNRLLSPPPIVYRHRLRQDQPLEQQHPPKVPVATQPESAYLQYAPPQAQSAARASTLAEPTHLPQFRIGLVGSQPQPEPPRGRTLTCGRARRRSTKQVRSFKRPEVPISNQANLAPAIKTTPPAQPPVGKKPQVGTIAGGQPKTNLPATKPLHQEVPTKQQVPTNPVAPTIPAESMSAETRETLDKTAAMRKGVGIWADEVEEALEAPQPQLPPLSYANAASLTTQAEGDGFKNVVHKPAKASRKDGDLQAAGLSKTGAEKFTPRVNWKYVFLNHRLDVCEFVLRVGRTCIGARDGTCSLAHTPDDLTDEDRQRIKRQLGDNKQYNIFMGFFHQRAEDAKAEDAKRAFQKKARQDRRVERATHQTIGTKYSQREYYTEDDKVIDQRTTQAQVVSANAKQTTYTKSSDNYDSEKPKNRLLQELGPLDKEWVPPSQRPPPQA